MDNLIATSASRTLRLHTKQEVQHWVKAKSVIFCHPFLLGVLLAIALWTLPNVLPRRNGTQPNPPQFYRFEQTVALSSLLMMTGILIQQNRQEKRAKQLAERSLQSNLRLKQKIAKAIALVEELRRNPANASNQHIPQIEVMRHASEWQAAGKALEETLAVQKLDTN